MRRILSWMIAPALSAALYIAPAQAEGVAANAQAPASVAQPVNAASRAAPETVMQVNGQGLSDIAVSWWQWLMSVPDDRDMLADKTGELCTINQSGDIWYLAGSYQGDKITRHCAVPAGKYIFVPVADTMLWDTKGGRDCKLLQNDVKDAIDTAHDMILEVDGKRLTDFKSYRAAPAKCFSLPNETDIYATEGYWVILPPLSKGAHIISFSSKLGDDGKTLENSAQNVEYQLDAQ